MFPQQDAIDVSATFTALNPARPGFIVCYRIDYKNNAPKTANGTITCAFDNLLTFQNASQTPISNINNTHGFVKFRISLKNNLPLGTVIRNNADIYFDYNQPVRTNTVANTISDLSHIVQPQSQPDCGWTVVQTEDYLNITGFKAELPAEAMLVDVYGKVVRVVHQISETFWIGDLPAGIYFVGLRDTNLCRQVRKITRF